MPKEFASIIYLLILPGLSLFRFKSALKKNSGKCALHHAVCNVNTA